MLKSVPYEKPSADWVPQPWLKFALASQLVETVVLRAREGPWAHEKGTAYPDWKRPWGIVQYGLVCSDARLALSRSGRSGTSNSASLQAIFSTECNVIRDEGFETKDFFNTESIQGGTDNIRGKTEV